MAKHRLVDVLVAIRSERPQPLLLRSVSRRCLLSILRKSPDKDTELIQVLVINQGQSFTYSRIKFDISLCGIVRHILSGWNSIFILIYRYFNVNQICKMYELLYCHWNIDGTEQKGKPIETVSYWHVHIVDPLYSFCSWLWQRRKMMVMLKQWTIISSLLKTLEDHFTRLLQNIIKDFISL